MVPAIWTSPSAGGIAPTGRKHRDAVTITARSSIGPVVSDLLLHAIKDAFDRAGFQRRRLLRSKSDRSNRSKQVLDGLTDI
jgi:hypothetical protein